MAGAAVRIYHIRTFLRHSLIPRPTRTLACVGGRGYCTAEKPTEAEVDVAEQLAQLTKDNTDLTDQLKDLKDKYQRTLADRENVRTRLEKQIVSAKQFAIQGFCKDLLEVSDVFRRAIDSVTEDQVKGGAPELKTLYDGLVMTENQLLSVFRRHGLKQINPEVGEKFDPAQQEAMFELPLPDKTPGTVAHVMRPGWTLHERCIRSAQVGVVKDT